MQLVLTSAMALLVWFCSFWGLELKHSWGLEVMFKGEGLREWSCRGLSGSPMRPLFGPLCLLQGGLPHDQWYARGGRVTLGMRSLFSKFCSLLGIWGFLPWWPSIPDPSSLLCSHLSYCLPKKDFIRCEKWCLHKGGKSVLCWRKRVCLTERGEKAPSSMCLRGPFRNIGILNGKAQGPHWEEWWGMRLEGGARSHIVKGTLGKTEDFGLCTEVK